MVGRKPHYKMPLAGPARLAFSVVIITRDALRELPACLDSVGFADEVIVVDSGSTDGTPDFAAGRGARVVHQDWLGFGRQKQFAVEQARHDWVLCVDADERVSAPLRTAIEQALHKPACGAFRMPRCNRFMGRWLRHGEGYPDWSLRLFDRRLAAWSDDPVHEKVQARCAVGKLDGDLLHESAECMSTYLEKQNRYSTLQARQMLEAGRHAGAFQLLLAPLTRFVKFYVLRLGLLDGVAGLTHILIGCYATFMKYAKLIAFAREREAHD